MRVNIDVDRSENRITINLSKDFYDIDSVRKCGEDFSGLCSAEIRQNGRLKIVLTQKGDVDIELLGYEFCNYLLALMKNTNIV